MLHQSAPEGVFQRLCEGGRILADIGAQGSAIRA
jgi:hypothetical protein